jgi:hypothetical protein
MNAFPFDLPPEERSLHFESSPYGEKNALSPSSVVSNESP